ncbi:MAG TPA: response regulator [Chloroflexota bacterium]|nr:response regulator [Chloroflexota bacterium]
MTIPGPANAGQPIALRTVMVVEDDEAIARLIHTVIAEIPGAQVETCRTGHEALTRAAMVQPDLVLLDLGLPGLYGTSVALALRQANRQLPIIVISALPGHTVAEDAWTIQAQAYLTKPFEPQALQELVRRYLQL